MSESDLDWLLHADGDEFLWLSGPFADEVASVPEGGWLHVPNLERCWLDEPKGHLFEGAFRAPLHERPDLEDAIYGKRARALSSGMGGHSSGKAIARVGTGFMAIHRVRDAEGGAELPYVAAPSAWMLHFDGITPKHWAVKNLRYAAQGPAMNQLLNRRRQATIGAILRAPNPEKAGVKVHQALFRLTPEEAEKLEAEGLLHRLDLDIEGSVEMIAPHLKPGFDAARFDSIHQAELEAHSQAIVRAKRRAKKRAGP